MKVRRTNSTTIRNKGSTNKLESFIKISTGKPSQGQLEDLSGLTLHFCLLSQHGTKYFSIQLKIKNFKQQAYPSNYRLTRISENDSLSLILI